MAAEPFKTEDIVLESEKDRINAIILEHVLC